MTQTPAVDQLRQETTGLLVERMRAGLRLTLVSISLFALADPFVFPALLRPLYALKLAQIAAVITGYRRLSRPISRRRAIVLAVLVLSFLCLTTAASGIITSDAGTTPILLIVLAMGAATLLPWGMRPQLALQIAAVLSILWNVYAVRGAEGINSMPVAVLVGSFVAVFAAHASERYQLEHRRAEAAEAEVEARQRQAEVAHAARLSTLGGLAAGLAHEINQPLSAIVSYARGCALRIEGGETRPETLLQAIDEISSQALRAGEVLKRIQAFVRHTQLPRERVDLNALVREALRFAEVEARRLGVQLRLELTPQALEIEADAIQIEQVILNLVRNGFEAMVGRNFGDRHLVIETATAPEGTVEFAVSDTGEGVPAAIAGRLFDPFFTTRRDGLGLGLAISRTIIEAHGGRLWTIPNPLQGATFRFALPRAGGGARHAA